jgi:hypothetical protein
MVSYVTRADDIHKLDVRRLAWRPLPIRRLVMLTSDVICHNYAKLLMRSPVLEPKVKRRKPCVDSFPVPLVRHVALRVLLVSERTRGTGTTLLIWMYLHESFALLDACVVTPSVTCCQSCELCQSLTLSHNSALLSQGI